METAQLLSSSLKNITNPGDPSNASFSIAACGSEKIRQIGLFMANTILRHAPKQGKKRNEQNASTIRRWRGLKK